MDKRYEQTFHQRNMKGKNMKRCSTSAVIREMQFKTTMTSHCTPVRKANLKINNTKCLRDTKDLELSTSADGKAK